ncbi:hypothetical protein J2S74_002097 [Evansella vedderi]|uniref:Uncharacterized protein n=1 Tax=Evansella vedderi TaxID=38282 RepID=A0ABT9ZTZ3_9BACI|nr:hypothetical protein [Evansella vedderi]
MINPPVEENNEQPIFEEEDDFYILWEQDRL